MSKKRFSLTVLILFFTAFFISNYWFQFVLIQGSSMTPQYHPWQLAVICKQSYQFEPGAVIAFRCETLNAILIKRIVACPGDTVQIKNGILYVNGNTAQDSIPYNSINFSGIAQVPLTLSSDEYFVLGDNLEESIDSRHTEVGCIKSGEILGIIFPQIP